MTDSSTRIETSELAALLGSRLCHDLVSPLGAIANGVELLQMSGSHGGVASGPEIQLISEAVEAARVRIQIFRMVFGQAAPDQRVSLPDVKKLLDAMAAQGKLRIRIEAEGDQPRRDIRMLLLAVMCLESAMPWGGQVIILRSGSTWRLIGDSDRMKNDPALWAWLNGPGQGADVPATPPAAKVHFALLAEDARTAGRQIRWELDEQGARISL